MESYHILSWKGPKSNFLLLIGLPKTKSYDWEKHSIHSDTFLGSLFQWLTHLSMKNLFLMSNLSFPWTQFHSVFLCPTANQQRGEISTSPDWHARAPVTGGSHRTDKLAGLAGTCHRSPVSLKSPHSVRWNRVRTGNPSHDVLSVWQAWPRKGRLWFQQYLSFSDSKYIA